MKLQAVDSDRIYAIGYDDVVERLVIVFHNQKIYQFFAVPQSVYEALLSADSIDHYMQTDLVGHYAYAQLLRRKRKRHR
jgi:hypothetical protein